MNLSNSESKRPFNIDEALSKIKQQVLPFPKAALFELAEKGFNSTFQILSACIISIRTKDEVTVPTSLSLFEKAKTPAEMLKLSVEEIDEIISPSTFHYGKAAQILEIAKVALEKFSGTLPCDFEILTSLKGVGPKCANLVLGIACNIPSVSVDVHVHRITNRWGYIAASTPEKSMAKLIEKLPRKHWIEINYLLVPFGKHICRGILPKCSVCSVLDMCRQIGVDKHK